MMNTINPHIDIIQGIIDVYSNKWVPIAYWTGNPYQDAILINKPHIKEEGVSEDRIQDTKDLLFTLKNVEEITLVDVMNIQNYLLKNNNWKGIEPGFRKHNVNLTDIEWNKVPELCNSLFPISSMSNEDLLKWYHAIQVVHPLSDLNGRVFGIIVSLLWN